MLEPRSDPSVECGAELIDVRIMLHNPLNPPLGDSLPSKVRWGQLSGASAALAISRLAEQASQPLLVVTPDNLSAQQLNDDIHFFRQTDSYPVLNFPNWETLPYDRFSPHEDIISERLKTLIELPELRRGIIIVACSSLMQRVPPREYVIGQAFHFRVGDFLEAEALRTRMTSSGYLHVSQVMEHGEYAYRGSIIDIFPMGAVHPYRIDLFDNQIDSIRCFDPDSQLSTEKIAAIELLPAHEFPLSETGISHFRTAWRQHFSGNPLNCPIYQAISEGISPAGAEYYLPLFFDQTLSLLAYLPETARIIRYHDINAAAEQYWHEVQHRYEQFRHDLSRPLLTPAEVFFPVDELFHQLNQFSEIYITPDPLKPSSSHFNFTAEFAPNLPIDRHATPPAAALANFIAETSNRILFCAGSAGRREVLIDLLQSIDCLSKVFNDWHEFMISSEKIGITVGPLARGIRLIDAGIIIITETELYGDQVIQRRQRQAKRFDADKIIRDLTELRIGTPVVHIQHGVGRYCGLQILDVGEVQTEFLVLQYEGDDKIYVPITSLELISRYGGADPDNAPLNRLGTDKWSRAKQKAAEKIRDIAAELLEIYAKREAQIGHQFTLPTENYSRFAAAFPFETTEDQQQTIEQVIADMTSEKMMDRLVCGDVGFGKTEVAMRAAFVAAENGKQVAVLVPTTLLASQHYENFNDRFADFAINIQLLSRFRSHEEQAAVLQDLQAGKADIVIGTHRLLQKDIKFRDLGLVIIDEEHRFGVNQKEILKAMRAHVDILSLTATPIPRTLNLALSGMRDISMITTPPARRLSVKTFVQEHNPIVIREAILREILRGGQVFFLHNKVQTIMAVAEQLQSWVPEAKFEIAHGQMPERQLEKVMRDFYHQQFNVLICTTIIENGIDIPTANTIIINRADHFGLAQLHQLRGRVGRSHHQAYAYLLTPEPKAMTSDAVKRLEAICALEDLGVGFSLATHDLEIRGAGEILGEEQSGHVQTIGFQLFMELLERAVTSLREHSNIELNLEPSPEIEVNCHASALIPEDYMPDINNRLSFYKRIASCKSNSELDALQVELIDRFGLLPDALKRLFQISELKLQAQHLGIQKIDINRKGGKLRFIAKPNIDPKNIIQLVQSDPKQYRFEGPQVLAFNITLEQPNQRIQYLQRLFKLLESRAALVH